MMQLQVNGQVYDQFTSISITRSMTAFSGNFTLYTSGNVYDSFPIPINSSVIVLINNTPVINGYVERISTTYDTGGHQITISGRDNTADLIDSTLGAVFTFSAPISLEDVTAHVLSYLGITGMNITTETDIDLFQVGEIVSAELGETCFQFLQKCASKKQVIITTDGNGGVLYTRSSTTPIASILDLSPTTPATIKTASLELDYTKRFNQYILHSQYNTAALSDNPVSDLSPKKATHVTASVTDDAIRPSRIYNFISDVSYTSDKAQQRCIWEANFRRAKSFKYTVTLQGFLTPIEKLVWKPNMLVTINDPVNVHQINSQLLTDKITYNQSISGGSTTEIQFVQQDTFNLELISGAKAKKIHKDKVEGYKFTG